MSGENREKRPFVGWVWDGEDPSSSSSHLGLGTNWINCKELMRISPCFLGPTVPKNCSINQDLISCAKKLVPRRSQPNSPNPGIPESASKFQRWFFSIVSLIICGTRWVHCHVHVCSAILSAYQVSIRWLISNVQTCRWDSMLKPLYRSILEPSSYPIAMSTGWQSWHFCESPQVFFGRPTKVHFHNKIRTPYRS